MNRDVSAVLVAHGTRKPGGVDMIGQLAERVSDLLDREVHVAFVDVLGPTPTEVLDRVPADRPAVVVPAFLAGGYHVRADVPAHVAASTHPAVTVTPPLGPCHGTVRVLADRLQESGWRPGDSVVMAAAGTSDRSAQSDLRQTAAMLSALIGDRVELGYAATGAPTVADAVQAARARGGEGRIAVASYLLADGLFQDRLRNSGADLVADPLGIHPGMVRLIASRFRRAAAFRLSTAA
ncbi:MAG: sirohydrochlorin chelatase [Mycolicibacterium neoaurum]|uniref:Cobalamin (Vitamin B12) biosynthesis CbiX protein n=1 Tax=Mycolicibacterium neoaurum TaxID=1795 RepID=A0AAV2WDY8_MYCNE|nr:sirohydrochlorin chelatase [Mycolicibacterium neoaurum]QVI28656.1 sirohydrochlorin chelatase [Mycolicibacterium neoaurum]TLH60786.1 sirohydrochlorin chelatase [Mycolicibacterium neoaurum]CDQ42470.1 cobalamin (vitamin B12) biosynthesis CbiX protein [Mycolicibacterium neoaurum]